MPKPGEHETVQARILAYAEAIGRTIVSREDWCGISTGCEAAGEIDKETTTK
jgi:hypothetical protein